MSYDWVLSTRPEALNQKQGNAVDVHDREMISRQLPKVYGNLFRADASDSKALGHWQKCNTYDQCNGWKVQDHFVVFDIGKLDLATCLISMNDDACRMAQGSVFLNQREDVQRMTRQNGRRVRMNQSISARSRPWKQSVSFAGNVGTVDSGCKVHGCGCKVTRSDFALFHLLVGA